MFLKRNRIAILLLDFLMLGLFLIPVLISKAVKKRRTQDPRRILIMELWGIGDLVMMSAVLKPLKERYPNSKITLFSKTLGKELFGESGYISEFVEFNFPWTKFKAKYKVWHWDWKGLLAIIMGLRRRKFDLILDARGDIRNNLLSFFIAGKKRIGYDWTGGGYFLTDVLSKTYKNNHRIDAWKNILNYLHIDKKDCYFTLSVSERQNRFVADFLKEYNIKDGDLVVGIHPGAAAKIRCWPIERFARVGEWLRDMYKSRIIVFIEPGGYGEDIPIQGEFIKAKVSLQEMAALIKEIDLLICNDSGAMHIATAVDTPLLAIFGPGDLERIGPYGRTQSIIANGIKCRPCYDSCKYKKAFCLDAIKVEDAIRAIDTIIKNKFNYITVCSPNS